MAFPKENESIAPRQRAILLLFIFSLPGKENINSYLPYDRTSKSLIIANRPLHPISILPHAYLSDHYKIETGTKCKSWGKIGTNLLM